MIRALHWGILEFRAKACGLGQCLYAFFRMEAEIERCDLAKSRIEEQESQLELERPKLEATSDPKARMDLKFLLAELEEGIREQKWVLDWRLNK